MLKSQRNKTFEVEPRTFLLRLNFACGKIIKWKLFTI